jgi:hypothetical protein
MIVGTLASLCQDTPRPQRTGRMRDAILHGPA